LNIGDQINIENVATTGHPESALTLLCTSVSGSGFLVQDISLHSAPDLGVC
jgi:hypothetical protein